MKKSSLCFYIIVFAMLILVFFTPDNQVRAEIPDTYFKGASIDTFISSFDVVSDSNHILKYDKDQLRVDSDYMTAEWIDAPGLGSNTVKILADCTNIYGDTYPVTMTHNFDGATDAVSGNFTFYANGETLGAHTFVVSCVLQGKTIKKTLIITVVRTVQGTSDIRYRTSGIIPKDIRLLSNQSQLIMSFTDAVTLPVLNLSLTSAAKNTLKNLIPSDFKNGQECMVTGIGVITVYNIRTNTTLGTYRLDTKYNNLISDFAWSAGALQDFDSKKNFKIPYRNSLTTKYIIDSYDVETSLKIKPTFTATKEYFGHQVESLSCELEPPNANGMWNIGGTEYSYLFHLIQFSGYPTLFKTNQIAHITFGILGAYDEYFKNKIGNNNEVKIAYYYRNPKPPATASPSPTPTPGPLTGRVFVSCISKNSNETISTLFYPQIDAGTLRVFTPPAISGYVHHPEDVNSITINISAGATYYVNFFYAKIGAITIEHRDKDTNALLASSEIQGLVLLEDFQMQANSYSPGYFTGYVHESYINPAISWWIDVSLTESVFEKTVTFYYVKAKCTLKYELYDSSKSVVISTKIMSLPLNLVIPARVNESGVETANGNFRYTGNNYTPGNTDTTLSLSEWDANSVITVRFQFEISSTVTITGAYQHWKSDPNRFLCLERITVTCFAQAATSMVIRLSPQLEAMKYTSPSGIQYDYFDFFQKHVYFPADSTVNFASGKAVWRYSLPLANETISWSDVRKKPPYYLDVTLKSGGYSMVRRFEIDITGKVTDVIHPW